MKEMQSLQLVLPLLALALVFAGCATPDAKTPHDSIPLARARSWVLEDRLHSHLTALGYLRTFGPKRGIIELEKATAGRALDLWYHLQEEDAKPYRTEFGPTIWDLRHYRIRHPSAYYSNERNLIDKQS